MPITSMTEVLPELLHEYTEKKKEVYASVDPGRPQHSTASKLASVLALSFGIFLMLGMPFVENQIRVNAPWWYLTNFRGGVVETQEHYEAELLFGGLPRMYGFVVIFSVLLPTIVTQIYIGFFIVPRGRNMYGYKLPVMMASVDIHVEDVIAHGNILSGGDVEVARKKLRDASNYSSAQRAHGNTLESLPAFLALSIVGGVRYPATTALHGLVWCVSRVVWANGYAAGVAPINRYNNPIAMLHWVALLGVMATSVGLSIGLVGGPLGPEPAVTG